MSELRSENTKNSLKAGQCNKIRFVCGSEHENCNEIEANQSINLIVIEIGGGVVGKSLFPHGVSVLPLDVSVSLFIVSLQI